MEKQGFKNDQSGRNIKNDIKIRKYWDLSLKKLDKPETFFVKGIKDKLSESIQKRMVSDVPLGVFLSGGIDSSSIVALMSEMENVNKPIKTYAVGFNEPWDEIGDARKVSEKFGTDHHEIYVESDVLERYPEFIWHMDTPKTNISPQYYISKLARESVTVALTGLGGDELFAGYRRHKYYYHQKNISALIPSSIGKPFFSLMSKVAISNYLKRGMIYLANIHDKEKTYTIAVPLLIFDNERKELYGKKMNQKIKEGDIQDFKSMLKPYFKGKDDYYNQTLKMEIKTYLTDDLLERMDRMSMANSIEARVPFLDHDLVEFAFSIPNKFRRFKMGTTAGKDILCKAMKGTVPDFVFKKKKAGFNMSPYYWFKSNLKEQASNILTEKRVNERGYFDYNYIEKVLKRKPDKNLYYQYQTLWNLMAFEIWHQMYIDVDRKRLIKPKLNINNY